MGEEEYSVRIEPHGRTLRVTNTRPVLEAVGVKCFPVDTPGDVAETFAGAADFAFNGGFSYAVLVSQRVIGAKGFGQD